MTGISNSTSSPPPRLDGDAESPALPVHIDVYAVLPVDPEGHRADHDLHLHQIPAPSLRRPRSSSARSRAFWTCGSSGSWHGPSVRCTVPGESGSPHTQALTSAVASAGANALLASPARVGERESDSLPPPPTSGPGSGRSTGRSEPTGSVCPGLFGRRMASSTAACDRPSLAARFLSSARASSLSRKLACRFTRKNVQRSPDAIHSQGAILGLVQVRGWG